MPKLLTDKQYGELKMGADNYAQVVSAIVASNSELKPEEITADIVSQMISQSTTEKSASVAELESALATSETNLTTAQNRIQELETENANLLAGPGADAAVISSDKETTAQTADISDFANKNAGDTLAILAECKAQGII